MDPQQVASEFCRLVESTDLLEYLGLPRTSTAQEATAALASRRKRLQGMQSNPKFRDSARFLIKNYRALEAALADPALHLEHLRKEAETERLPLLELALESILVDGRISPQEEAFVRRTALSLGFSLERYEEVLRARAASRGVLLPDGPSGPPAWKGGRTVDRRSGTTETERRLRGAEGHGWWDAAFTRLLLEAIPGGPGELVDVYCRAALSAITLLPQRRQLAWLGVDRSPARIEEARRLLPDVGTRITLAVGEPDALPLPDQSVDFVLAIRALANVTDTRPVLAEAARVLRPGGRLIVAEPDGLGESFYFGEHLAEYNAAFRELLRVVEARVAPEVEPGGRPGLALGPRLPQRIEAAGLEPLATRVHTSQNLKPRTFGRLSGRLRAYPAALARTAHLPDDHVALLAVVAALAALEERWSPDDVALSGHVLPLFLSVGRKP